MQRASTKVGRLSKLEAIFNMCNIIVGSGILALPYAMSLTGGVLGTILLVVVSAGSTLSGLMVGWCLELCEDEFMAKGVPRHLRDFSAIAATAFGPLGRIVMQIICLLQLWFCSEAFLIFLGWNMHCILPVSQEGAIVIAGIAAFALDYVPEHSFAYVSLIGFAAAALSLIALLAAGMSLPEQDMLFWENHDSVKWDGAFEATGIILFSTSSHSGLPAVYTRMRNPEADFSPACSAAFALCTLAHAAAAMIGWYFYGNYISQSFTENIGFDLGMQNRLPATLILRWMTCAAFCIKIQAALPLAMRPVLVTIQSFLGIDNVQVRKSPPYFVEDQTMSRTRLMQCRFASKIVLTGFSVLMALYFEEQLGFVLAITGCFFGMVVAIIFPFAAYLALVGREAGLLTWLGLGSCTLMGIAFAVIGTYGEVMKLF